MDVTTELWQSNVFLQSLPYSLPKYEIRTGVQRSSDFKEQNHINIHKAKF